MPTKKSFCCDAKIEKSPSGFPMFEQLVCSKCKIRQPLNGLRPTNEKSEKKLQPKIIQITAHSGVILGLSDRGEVFVLNDGESPWQLINARGFYNVVNGLGDNDSKHLFKF